MGIADGVAGCCLFEFCYRNNHSRTSHINGSLFLSFYEVKLSKTLGYFFTGIIKSVTGKGS